MSYLDGCSRQPAGEWFKSSRSNQGSNCVEVKLVPGAALIRDSKYLRDPANDPSDQPVISVPLQHWSAFLAVVQEVTAAGPGMPGIELHADGSATLDMDMTSLTFTCDEWTAFKEGAAAGEFGVPQVATAA